jgi:hypothetical protein
VADPRSFRILPRPTAPPSPDNAGRIHGLPRIPRPLLRVVPVPVVAPRAREPNTPSSPNLSALQLRIAARILMLEDVAWLLGASIDTIRRIPRNELRAAPPGPGRKVVYLLDDVIDYVRLKARPNPHADVLLAAMTRR